ncbi:hypothetical protein CIK76_01475 [Glutamicibacter sp. BW80]|uniref:hypothetical protein n=1 Tax=unclassified Glutamicibacter TaxID=2627139 RepID=UPI000BB73EB0|nr:hypothetical protein [Glutamicibacter sp. BW80]PCC30398.1 hypothetical protein CIK76_01475 [Glutamicibacter sp. BW80]
MSKQAGRTPPAGGKPAGRVKRPRVIAPPQQLSVKAELTGSYAPVPAGESVDRALAASRDGSTENAEQPKNPLAELRAKDDDPRMWGEPAEDLAEAMKRDKPPHWG